jgi:hypothetical protein
MGALQNLLSDGKGLVGAGLIVAATVLAALGKLPITEWESFMEWVFGIYAGSTALHGGLAAIGSGIGSSPTTTATAASPGPQGVIK